jgi:DNA helicase II / ATP-dependent DNA helicase PcrA
VRHVLASAGLSATAPAARGAVRERWESLTAIAGLADAVAAARPAATLAEFAAEMAERAESGHAPVASAVTLATMHAAKGLEWDAVHVPGLTEGIMPIVHARTAEAVEEERRLLYVAVTRARVHLELSWAQARTPGGEAFRPRSRFLASLAPAEPQAADPRTGAPSAGASRPGQSRAAQSKTGQSKTGQSKTGQPRSAPPRSAGRRG